MRRRSAPAWILSLLLCACGPPAPRSLILISLDTLRADHLGAYGHELPTSPELDAFAAGGALFERALAPAPWTLPSHASLLTGVYPSRHGALTKEDALPEGLPTLARLLGERGFETAGFVNVMFLGPPYGFPNGFQTYRDLPETRVREGAARDVTDAGLAWLQQRKGRRVFLFLHYFDLHSDYQSLPRYERMFVREPGRLDGTTGQLLLAKVGRIPVEPADVEHLRRLYDAEIRQLDAELGRLFDRLEQTGWLEESLVVVTSDHGEQFWEHGGPLHNVHYQEVLHVPLILRGPGIPRGVRSAARVSLVDVVPTALRLLGFEPPPGLDGVDLSPFWRDPAAGGGARRIFAEGGPSIESAASRSVQDGRYKLIVDLESDARELYDLAADPGEQTNLAEGRPEVVRELRAALDALRARSREARPASGLSDDLEQRLRELGYAE